MMNIKYILIGLVVIALAGGVFYISNRPTENAVDSKPIVKDDTSQKEDVVPETPKQESTICDEFPKNEVASVTGLNITSTKVFTMGEEIENSNCGYYIDGKTVASALTIGVYKGDVSKQKEKYQNPVVFRGWRILTDKTIPMDHFITYNEVQQLNDIYLIKGPQEYYRISLFSLSAVKSGQMFDLALKVAEKIK